MCIRDRVYAGRITLEDSKKSLKSLINVGNNPTFGFRNTLIEVYILNFNKNIYNKKITVKFLKYLRQETKFASANDLIVQIKEDIKRTCDYFKSKKKL